MNIDTPLFAFEIIPFKALADSEQDGSNVQAAIKINNTTFAGKGTIDYCIDVRRDVLTNRGFVVPQDWELTWNRHVGPIWTPDQMPSVHMWCHQKGIFSDTNSDKCTKWQSELDENHYFSQSVEDDCPEITTNGQNGFKYLAFDGVNEYMVIPKTHHTDHPLSGQATTCDCNPGDDSSGNTGKGDFIVAMVVDGNVDSQNADDKGVVANYRSQNWSIEKNTSDGATVDHDGTQMLSVASTYDDPELIIMAKISGATSLRQSSATPAVSTESSKDCSVNYSLTPTDSGRGQLGRAQLDRYASMHLYEFVIAKGTDITLDDVKKL